MATKAMQYLHHTCADSVARDPLALQRLRDLSAVLGQLNHDLPMQPDIHLCGIVHIAGVVQFFRQFLACRKAAVEIKQLHQIDNRLPPIKFFLFLASQFDEDSLYVDLGLRTRARAGFW
jgi:hypothetical protein